MQPITHDTIRKMAADLAEQLLPVLLARAGQPAGDLSPDALAGPLTPGVAAFTGAIMVMVPDQDDIFEYAAGRFLADPPTAEALGRYLAGDSSAEDDLFNGLLNTGLRGGLAFRYALSSALDMMVKATTSALFRAIDQGGADAAAAERVLALLAAGGPALMDYFTPREFVDQYYALGFDHLEPGQMIAADGQTILYTFGAPLMSGPPDEMAESVGPEPPETANGGGELETIGETSEPPEDPPKMTGSEPPPPMPPPPAPPPPAPGGPDGSVVDLRLDAALPDHVTVGRAFDLAVAIRRPTSPVTTPDDLGRSESADFAAVWPAGESYIQFQIQVSAPDCDIQGGDARDVRLYAGKDSPLVYFQLTPRAAGPLSVIITVYQATDWIGSTRLRTEATLMEPRGAINVTVDSRPVGNGEVNLLTLRAALDDGYSDSELRDVCFELGIDYDDLPGDNQSAKARELVLFAKRRDLTADLVRLIMRDRPHLLG